MKGAGSAGLMFEGISVLFVSEIGCVCEVYVWFEMDFSDSDSDFCLTQVPSTSYMDINSSQFGMDIQVESEDKDIVSLESAEKPIFDIGYDVSQQSKSTRVLYGDVEIEDISDFSDQENM